MGGHAAVCLPVMEPSGFASRDLGWADVGNTVASSRLVKTWQGKIAVATPLAEVHCWRCTIKGAQLRCYSGQCRDHRLTKTRSLPRSGDPLAVNSKSSFFFFLESLVTGRFTGILRRHQQRWIQGDVALIGWVHAGLGGPNS